jgi:KUP system potassium uptake protein
VKTPESEAPVILSPTPVPQDSQATAAHNHDEQAFEDHAHALEHPTGKYLAALCIGALGVVYGDIGTSPLYAVRESLNPAHGISATDPANVLGVISLIVWTLVVLLCVKYVTYILRADRHNEGGILTLAALVGNSKTKQRRIFPLLLTMGLFGTALLYGDGMITPAISVLSAVEGLSIATPIFDPYFVPITIVILIGLFFAQSRGTEAVGKIFGPIMLVWFFSLAGLGLGPIIKNPEVLHALSPLPGLAFFLKHRLGSLEVLGSVFLVVTGGEALYADMGHFGRKPIRYAWFILVFPSLILCYLGQGALILTDPKTVDNPFFRMIPPHLLYFEVILATAATVIASQALISGAFSLTLQAVQLGYLPRLRVDHTSALMEGQVYVPAVNWALMIACIGLVLGFRTSSNLAAAYGVAVTGTMLITTILFYYLTIDSWNWNPLRATLVCGFFGLIETIFFLGNIIKIPEGGWFPVVIGLSIFLIMTTWANGRKAVAAVITSQTVPLQQLLDNLQSNARPLLERRSRPEGDGPVGADRRKNRPDRNLLCEAATRVPGTAVFMYGNRKGSPPAMLSNLRHNKVLHDRIVLVAVEVSARPYLEPARTIQVVSLGHGFYRAFLQFGFMDMPNVPDALARAVCEEGTPLITDDATFFLGKETLVHHQQKFSGMPVWRENIFAFLSRNAQDATAFFGLPPERVVELGMQVEI